MEREKLLEEYKVVLDCLVEKSKFVYSEEFYKLDEYDKQKHQRDKMATEAHLSTLCNLLWGDKAQLSGGLADMFALGLIGSMFGGGWGNPTTQSNDYLKNALGDSAQVTEVENKAE